LLLLFLAVSILAVYLPTLSYPFHYDDRLVILDNPGLQVQGWGLRSWALILRSSPRAVNRPVAQVSFVLNHRLSGMDPRGWRAVNILIHLASTLLLFAIGLSFFSQAGVGRDRAAWASLSGAALWGLHPLQTQAVTYIVQRMTSMMTLFFLLGIYLYLRARAERRGRSVLLWAGCFISFLLALGTKENAAVFPFAVLLLELFLRGGWKGLREVKRSHLAVMLVLVFAYLVLLENLYTGGGKVLDGFQNREYTMGQRMLTQPRILLLYLSLLVFPLPGRMAIDRDPLFSSDLLNPWTTTPALLLLVLAVILSLRGMRLRSPVSFAILWFLGTIFLESSFLPLDLVYEHRVYLPTTMPALVAGFYLTGLFQSLDPKFPDP
jgi:hypothetical protein